VTLTYETVRDWVLALPGTTEVMVEAFGHPTLRVNDKKFVGGGPGYPSVTVKATLDKQRELIERASGTYAVAPYVGRHGWVEVTLAKVDPDELHELIVEAWKSVAPKKMVAEFEG
jgi:hypothetical protein